jgi:transmembrane sensor
MASSDQIEATAADWLARRDREDFSAEEAAELGHWLQSSTANRIAFLRLEAVWRKANRLQVLGAGLPPRTMPHPGEWRSSPFFSGEPEPSNLTSDVRPTRAETAARHWILAIAASIAMAMVGTAGWFWWPRGPQYKTEVGGVEAVPIADGSKLILNTNTRVRVLLTEEERRVDLDQGEAFFEVAKDPTRPFVVGAGDLRVVAVGTKFSVKRETEGLRVVVTEGVVRVEKDVEGTEQVLTEVFAGSIAHSRAGGVLVREESIPQAEEALSWRSGFVVFRATPLTDAVAEFNRYNTRKIRISDPSIASFRVSGNFRAANAEAFARLLEQGFSIRAETKPEEIILHAE